MWGLSSLERQNATEEKASCDRFRQRRNDLPEYLFVSLFRVCAESLANENARGPKRTNARRRG